VPLFKLRWSRGIGARSESGTLSESRPSESSRCHYPGGPLPGESESGPKLELRLTCAARPAALVTAGSQPGSAGESGRLGVTVSKPDSDSEARRGRRSDRRQAHWQADGP
jgi:hypothetical protein